MPMHRALTARAVIVLDDANDRREVAWLDERDRVTNRLTERAGCVGSPRLDGVALGARPVGRVVDPATNAASATRMEVETIAGVITANAIEIESVRVRESRHQPAPWFVVRRSHCPGECRRDVVENQRARARMPLVPNAIGWRKIFSSQFSRTRSPRVMRSLV